MSITKLRLTFRHHKELYRHLFPGDDLEALAFALCGKTAAIGTDILIVHRIEIIPYDLCKRSSTQVNWHPTILEPLLREASEKGFSILKVHSHPCGFEGFSNLDNDSDTLLFESIYGWIDGDGPHGSAIMLPCGRLLARAVRLGGAFTPINTVEIVGDDVCLWTSEPPQHETRSFTVRHAQLFGDGTTNMLGAMRVAVVGCSGTGSPVIEQLVRLGVGELILVDPDHVEEKNLNRILGATADDAQNRRPKVDVLARHIAGIGLGTRVHPFQYRLEHHDAIKAIAASDFVIGCMDTLSGRNVLARLIKYYVLPYVDVGVKLEALQDGTINQVAGSVHYLQPDGQGFIARGVFSADALAAEDLLRSNPDEYRLRRQEGYIRGVDVDRPAVISVNMCFASFAVMELLARIHPFRMDDNVEFATTRFSFSHSHLEHEPEDETSERVRKIVGLGDVSPMLGMPGLMSPQELDS